MSTGKNGSLVISLMLAALLFGCADDDYVAPTTLEAGAASMSILPTLGGNRSYLQDAPGWPAAPQLDPLNPGVFVAAWDQGQVDVGNGDSDSAWVHSDIRVTAVALKRAEQRVVLVSTDTYMHFAADADVMAEQARGLLPDDWQNAEILIAATHNHNGPDTAFSINDDWHQMMADQTALAIVDAVASLQPAVAAVASGEHSYGSVDQRDPLIFDNRLNVTGGILSMTFGPRHYYFLTNFKVAAGLHQSIWRITI